MLWVRIAEMCERAKQVHMPTALFRPAGRQQPRSAAAKVKCAALAITAVLPRRACDDAQDKATCTVSGCDRKHVLRGGAASGPKHEHAAAVP